MVRGKKPIELGNSWFYAKTIEVVHHKRIFLHSKALNGVSHLVKVIQSNYESVGRNMIDRRWARRFIVKKETT